MGKQAANIWCAASDGDLARVRALVEGDSAMANASDENGYTPLHAAASWKHLQVLRYLLDNGGSVNIVDADGDTPLHICEDRECAALLLSRGADPEKRNHEGLTPVHTTLENEATEVTELLCKRLGIPVPTLAEVRDAELAQAHGAELAEISPDTITESKLEDLSNWIMQQVDKDSADEGEVKDMVTSYILKNLRIANSERKDDTVAATVASSTDRRSQDDDPPAAAPAA
ncbi:hypothetical protein LPJ61_003593 [Coemansia biformis]|uniref:Ankyrin n=1 Tax=Coemansia biformis TaxID=1286918 RepID=A0A9W8CY32_9FUNG|nr:hypothetical protein LPJ61_003593 [Coemansia biformis]